MHRISQNPYTLSQHVAVTINPLTGTLKPQYGHWYTGRYDTKR